MSARWSFEVPVPHLKDFNDLQDFHFMLSMLCRIEGYQEYHLPKPMELKWIDNSFTKDKFLINEFFTMSVLGALERSGTYSKSAIEKARGGILDHCPA